MEMANLGAQKMEDAPDNFQTIKKKMIQR